MTSFFLKAKLIYSLRKVPAAICSFPAWDQLRPHAFLFLVSLNISHIKYSMYDVIFIKWYIRRHKVSSKNATVGGEGRFDPLLGWQGCRKSLGTRGLTRDNAVLAATHTFIHNWNEPYLPLLPAAKHHGTFVDTHFPPP